MPFQYKKVLMIGATSGIGAAMADGLVEEGSNVIAVGRRQDRLDAFVRKHGAEKVSAVKFDISNRAGIDRFVNDITTAYSDLDCVFLNAGVQSSINLAEPQEVNLDEFHSEVETNFTCFVDLTMKFLPFLMHQKTETCLVYTGSGLSLIPAVNLPAYSASKAALNAFVMCLRRQLNGSSVKVIDLWPPVVQTELHDYMGQESGRQFGMPLDAFTDQAYRGLVSGKDQVTVGSIGPEDTFNEIINKRRAAFEDLSISKIGDK